MIYGPTGGFSLTIKLLTLIFGTSDHESLDQGGSRHLKHRQSLTPKSSLERFGTGIGGYTCHIPKFSFQNVNHFSHKKLKISKKNSFILKP
jgi:hypothetical protein